ncbi:hypothetical protein ACLMJK_001740 [Lecanora helva]
MRLKVLTPAVPSRQDHVGSAYLDSFTNYTNISYSGQTPSIEHCSIDRLRDLERAIFIAQAAAQLAKEDVIRGVESPFGFKALFKVSFAVFQVSSILEAIYKYSKKPDLKPSPGKGLSPRFVCATPNSVVYYAYLDLRYDPWRKCQQSRSSGRPSQAFWADGTAYIFICPTFFSQAVVQPPSYGSRACPSVVNNKFVGNVNIFYKDYQIFTLLYVLIRFYIGSPGLTPNSQPREDFDWNQCLQFPWVASILNPTNLLLYIALVQQRCTAIPEIDESPSGPYQGTAPSSLEVSDQGSNISVNASTVSIDFPYPTSSDIAVA